MKTVKIVKNFNELYRIIPLEHKNSTGKTLSIFSDLCCLFGDSENFFPHFLGGDA